MELGRKIVYLLFPADAHMNQRVLLCKYDFVNWATISKFMEKLPEASREKFKVFIAEGHLAKILLQAALEGAGASARIMALSVTMRRA